jgi:hypothetical protein
MHPLLQYSALTTFQKPTFLFALPQPGRSESSARRKQGGDTLLIITLIQIFAHKFKHSLHT